MYERLAILAQRSGLALKVQPIALDHEDEGLFVYLKPDREQFGAYFDEWGNWPEMAGIIDQPWYVLYLDASEESQIVTALVRKLFPTCDYAVRPVAIGQRCGLITKFWQSWVEGVESIQWLLALDKQLSDKIIGSWAEKGILPSADSVSKQRNEARMGRIRQMADENMANIVAQSSG